MAWFTPICGRRPAHHKDDAQRRKVEIATALTLPTAALRRKRDAVATQDKELTRHWHRLTICRQFRVFHATGGLAARDSERGSSEHAGRGATRLKKRTNRWGGGQAGHGAHLLRQRKSRVAPSGRHLPVLTTVPFLAQRSARAVSCREQTAAARGQPPGLKCRGKDSGSESSV